MLVLIRVPRVPAEEHVVSALDGVVCPFHKQTKAKKTPKERLRVLVMGVLLVQAEVLADLVVVSVYWQNHF